jgi:uncharacterized membrane protein YhaH (DUF805 family)
MGGMPVRGMSAAHAFGFPATAVVLASIFNDSGAAAMNFTQAISSGFQNYVNFSGRAARSEYWYWTLFATLVSIAASLVDHLIFPMMDFSPLHSLAGLALFLPGIAVAVRRLHDLDRTGWWLLIILTVIGGILLLVWFCMRGTVGPNRYGPDPLEGVV